MLPKINNVGKTFMDHNWNGTPVDDIGSRKRVRKVSKIVRLHHFKTGKTIEALIPKHINIDVVGTSEIKTNQSCKDMVKQWIKNNGGWWQ